jgi:RecA/RadA recombinase
MLNTAMTLTGAGCNGVNPEELIYIEPPHLEGVFDRSIAAIKKLAELKNTALSLSPLIVYPQLLPLPNWSRKDSTAGKQNAAHAVIISMELRKMRKLLVDQNVALLFVSQLKDNPRAAYGNTHHKLGGDAIWFHSGLMLRLLGLLIRRLKTPIHGPTKTTRPR